MLKEQIEKQRKHLENKINEKGDLRHHEVLRASIELDTLIEKYNRKRIEKEDNKKVYMGP